MNTSFRLNIFKRTFKLAFRSYKSFDTFLTGITNRCNNGEYILFLDYDEVPIKWIEEELNYLLETQDLNHFYLFKTNKGYHAINLEKRPLKRIIELLDLTSTDYNFKIVPLMRAKKVWTLRITPKKSEGEGIKYLKLLTTIKNNGLVISSPHYAFLRKFYKVTKLKNILEDGEEDFTTSYYHITG